ncbi:glycosyltransferase [Oceanidesulfovibrio marinus]|uniref:Glycosyltransferase family 4 protein n=1 Tax=Oceanidesulfovibrio marinus TaxID=370038 RepID=A0ABX6NGP7_9BACT|nr:glycosyltransferase [Oceanidesulfovibrio marinus]QJT09798.1 glycosyltransferase family 4 protein [Oceanidesulfovibrio marinus]
MPADKKILITTYHNAFLNKGGGEYELLEVALNLRKMGHIADVYSPYSRSVQYYDIIIHFSVEEGGLGLLRHVKSEGKKVILWPNLWVESHDRDRVKKVAAAHLDLADAVVFKSRTEEKKFKSVAWQDNTRSIIVPAGVDPSFAQAAPSRLFRSSYDLDTYLLWVGIIEPTKNQLSTIEALADFDLPLVIVGDYRDKEYYAQCRAAAPEHFLFLDPIAHNSDLIRSAMQECRLYIETSLDPPGKSVIEAAIAGAPLLVRESAWAREHFGDAAFYLNADDAGSIREGIERTLDVPKKQVLRNDLMKKHLFPDVLSPLTQLIAELTQER